MFRCATRAIVGLLALVVVAAATTAPLSAAPRTACDVVIHVGDSLSAAIRGPLLAGYRSELGVPAVMTAYRGRGIIFRRSTDRENGLQAVDRLRRTFADTENRCWVIALGTNDAGAYTRAKATRVIDRLLELVGDDRAVWVNVWMISKHPNRYFSMDSATRWNRALHAVAERRPNLTIADWAAHARPNARWFTRDGIHHVRRGNVARKDAILKVVTQAFSEPPTSEPPTSEPPTSGPPTSEPPTSEPPTSGPPD